MMYKERKHSFFSEHPANSSTRYTLSPLTADDRRLVVAERFTEYAESGRKKRLRHLFVHDEERAEGTYNDALHKHAK